VEEKPMATLAEQLDAMRKLEENWDGYGAACIEPRLVATAHDFVQFFQAIEKVNGINKDIMVQPTRVGGVQIEWRDAKFEHELELNPDGSIGILHVDRATGEMTEEIFRPPTEPSVLVPGLLGRLAAFGELQGAA
jgi:hypothetical protein